MVEEIPMDKVVKQLVINVVIIFVSVIVIFVAKSFSTGEIMEWKEYLGADIMFVMITSLVTTVGWRFVESIVVHWGYNVFMSIALFFLVLGYGLAMAQVNNQFVIYYILISMLVFFVLYVIENIWIILHFKRVSKKNRINNVGYVRREEK